MLLLYNHLQDSSMSLQIIIIFSQLVKLFQFINSSTANYCYGAGVLRCLQRVKLTVSIPRVIHYVYIKGPTLFIQTGCITGPIPHQLDTLTHKPNSRANPKSLPQLPISYAQPWLQSLTIMISNDIFAYLTEHNNLYNLAFRPKYWNTENHGWWHTVGILRAYSLRVSQP